MLPLLWVVNAVWFAKQAFLAPHFEEQKQIRRCKFFFLFTVLLILNVTI